MKNIQVVCVLLIGSLMLSALTGLEAQEIPVEVLPEDKPVWNERDGTWRIGDWSFIWKTGNKAAVTEFHGDAAASMVIPQHIGEFEVTELGRDSSKWHRVNQHVFPVERYANTITAITLPDTVLRIKQNAFSGLTNLANVVLPDTIKNIESTAFSDTAITSLKLPESLTEIEEMAFYGSRHLTNVVIPDSVIRIGPNAFTETGLTSLELGDNITEIGYRAFANSELVAVVLPNKLTEIPPGLFAGCERLKSVTFGSQTLKISENAFARCSSLEEVSLPVSLEEIGEGAFKNCTSLIEISFPSGLKTVGEDAFQGCTALNAVSCNEGLLSLGSMAFRECHALEYFAVPATVQRVGLLTFYECSSLAQVTIPSRLVPDAPIARRGKPQVIPQWLDIGLATDHWRFKESNGMLEIIKRREFKSQRSSAGNFIESAIAWLESFLRGD